MCSTTSRLIDAARAKAHAEGRALLVQFGASWCASCKAVAPKVAAATRAPAAPVLVDVDVDRCMDDVGVSSVPTLRLFCVGNDDRPVTHVGPSGVDSWLATNGLPFPPTFPLTP